MRRAASAKGPEAADLLYQAALLLRQRGDLPGAVHALEQAIRTIAEFADSAQRSGAASIDTGTKRAALEFLLGQIFEEDLGRLDGALLHYQRAFKLQPEVTQPLHRGRAIYRMLGDLPMVGRLFELELDSLPPAPAANEARRSLSLEFARLRLRQQHDPAGTVQILETLLQDQPPADFSDEILETLGEAYVSPDLQDEGAELRQAAQRRASQLYLTLGLRYAPASAAPGKANPETALLYLRRALGADPTSQPAALALEQLYKTLPSPQREQELMRLYRTGARVPRRGLKLLAFYEARPGPGQTQQELGPEELREAIAACRAGLEEAESIEEWTDTKATLRRLMQQAGDLAGLAGLLEEEAAEAALPDERATALLQAADLYRKAGDSTRLVATLEEAVRTAPQHPEAFRRLTEYHGGRRDFAALAGVHELRLISLQESEQLDGPTYIHHLEELADIYEKRLQDIAAAAKVWRRIDEFEPTTKSHEQRKRLGQRLSRTERQIAELQMELDHRTPADAVGKRSDLLRKLAQLYREQHDPDRAAAMYRELLLFAPNDVPALKALYELREQDNNVPEQIELLVRQVEAAGDRAERLGLLRRIVTLCGQLPSQSTQSGQAAQAAQTAQGERLIWACRALLSELPSDRDTLRRLAEAQERAGDKRGLLDTLETHVKLAPNPREKIPLHKQIAALAEETGDLARGTAHLERAARLCPPGPDSEAVLVELARLYGKQGRPQEQIQALELALRQNAKASAETYRALARAAQPPSQRDPARDKGLDDKALRAWREVLQRLPSDLEALESLGALHRARGEWSELASVLRRCLAVPDQAPDKRLGLGLDLAEVLSQRLDDRAGALQILIQLQAETPHCDRQFHHRLRGLHEDLGDHVSAIRCAERELLLTQDPLSCLELAMQIAGLWRHKVKDPGRALLSYERVLELLPEDTQDPLVVREGRRLIAQAMDAMSELYSEAADWPQVVALGERRLAMSQGEPMRAACILLELAAVCEEKLRDPRRGFGMRRRAWELAPEMVQLQDLAQVAAGAGLWQDLAALHYARIQGFRDHGKPAPLDSLLAAAQIHEQRLGEPGQAHKLLRSAVPTGRDGPVQATTPGHDGATVLQELLRLARAAAAQRTPEANSFGRDLLGLLHQYIEELCGQRGAASEEVAVRLHRLLAMAAQVREEVLGDLRGALEERLRAFTLGGERDLGGTAAADAIFGETVAEVRRLALATGQVKEALAMDQRRLERADTDLRKQQVACDVAAWIDDATGEPPKALRACLKALSLCEDGSDAQAEIRGRLLGLGGRLGTLAWEEIARAERSLPVASPSALRRRLRYVGSLWELGAGEFTRAVEAVGQAYRLTFFPGVVEQGRPGKGPRPPAPPVAEVALSPQDEAQAAAERPVLRAELERLAGRAPTDGEGPARVVALLDGLAAQLTESGDPPLAQEVLLDAARTDERRGRLPHAERRYQEVLKSDPGSEEAFAQLERLYRKQRRPQDLAGLLERRRNGLLERLPPGPARRAMLLELGEIYQQLNKAFEALEVYGGMATEDDSDPEPHHRMARVHEGQRAYARAAEGYTAEAERARRQGEGGRALRAFARAGEVWEKQVSSPERALQAYTGAFLQAGVSGDAEAVQAADSDREAQSAAVTDREARSAAVTDRQAALAGIERILEKQQRFADYDGLLAQRLAQLAAPVATADASADTPVLAAGPTAAPAERVDLLWRRIRLLREKLRSAPGSLDEALHCAAELAGLLPDDDEVLALHEGLLVEAGQASGQKGPAAQATAARAQAAGRRGAGEGEQAALWAQASERYLEAGERALAEEALRRALALRPDDLASLRALAQMRLDAGDVRGHIEALRTLAGRHQDAGEAAELLLRAADLLLREPRDAAGAEALLREALDRRGEGPTALSALQRLGELRMAAQDYDAARGYAERELALREQDRSDAAETVGQRAELHGLLGRLALQRGERDAARTHFEAALALRPGQLSSSVELAHILWQEQSYQRVEALLRDALEHAPDLAASERARLLRMQAEACEKLGETAACYDALREAEQLLPGGAREHLLLGEAAYQLGHADVAAHYLGGLLSAEEQGGTGLGARVLADALIHGARAALSQQQREPARRLLAAALERAPGHAEGEQVYLEFLLSGGEGDQREVVERLGRRGRKRGAGGDLAGGVHDFSEAAQVAERLGPGMQAQARQLLEEALGYLHGDSEPALQEQVSLLLLDLVQRAGDLGAAREHAGRLVRVAREPVERAERLQRLAELDVAAGQKEQARAHLEQALSELAQDQHGPRLETLRRLVPLLDDAGRAALLEVELRHLPVPEPPVGPPSASTAPTLPPSAVTPVSPISFEALPASAATPVDQAGVQALLQMDREARSAAVNDREARSAAVMDREAHSAAVMDREARSAAVMDREARSAAVNDREAPQTPRFTSQAEVPVRLWAALGAAQAQLGHTAAAAEAYERAVAQAHGLGRALELELRRAALADLDLAVPESARGHLTVLLQEDPVDVGSLRRMQRLEVEAGHVARAQRLGQILQVLEPGDPPAPVAVGPIPAGLVLEEQDHLTLADPGARVLSEVMASLFEGVVSVKSPGVEALGVGPSDRTPPLESSPDEVVRWAAQALRVLGNKRATLYRGKTGTTQLGAHAPTALVLGPELGHLPPPQAIFLLGRAVELLRPEYLLADALTPAAYAELLGLAIRAFHPRHVRHASDDVAAWRRELPYKTVKRLSDLLKEQADVRFSSALWRQAVRRTANRAGLLLCGDLPAAAAALRALEPSAGLPHPADALAGDLRDLIEFWQSTAAALDDRLHQRT